MAHDLTIADLEQSVSVVQIDALVALKIIKHCRENLPEIMIGTLLGLDVGSTLEVTNCFAVPANEDASSDFQLEMLRCLRDVNVDSNTVGWYTSAVLGSNFSRHTVEAQERYQNSYPRSVVIVYDPDRSGANSLSLTAYRLSNKFLKLYRQSLFTKESLAEHNLSFTEIYDAIPIEIVNSGILRAMLWEVSSSTSLAPTFDAFDLSSSSFLESHLDQLLSCVGELQNEQGRFQLWQRNVYKQQVQQQTFITKRKADNQARKATGMDPLPETQEALEAENPQLFRLPAEPNRLESLLITNQINQHCQDILRFGGQTLSKFFAAKADNK